MQKKDKGRVRKVKKKTKKKKVMRKKKIKRKKRGSSSSSHRGSLRTPVPKPEYDIFDPQFKGMVMMAKMIKMNEAGNNNYQNTTIVIHQEVHEEYEVHEKHEEHEVHQKHI